MLRVISTDRRAAPTAASVITVWRLVHGRKINVQGRKQNNSNRENEFVLHVWTDQERKVRTV